VIDAGQPWVEPRLVRAGGALPNQLEPHIPLRLPKGWSAQYSRSADQGVLLAYLYQRPPGESGESTPSANSDAKTARLLELVTFPAGARQYQVFALATRQLSAQRTFDRSTALELDPRARNLFVYVGPQP